MEVKTGFKQTDVGVIPNDWGVKKLGTLGRVIRGASPRPQGDKRYYGGNIPRLMVEDVTRDGKFVTPQVDFLTEEGAKRSRPCKRGTLTIVCSGTVGIPSFLEVDACIHDGFLALVDINKQISDDYLYHELSMVRNRFENSATHGGVFTNLTTDILSEFQVPFPPTKDEQRAIAATLSDVDALLAVIDAIISKKRLVKQGATQELLTGNRRLLGFNGEWEEKKLGDFTEIFKGNGLSKGKIVENGKRKCILYGELFTSYKRIITEVFSSTDADVGVVSMKGDVLMPGSTTTIGIDLAIASALMLPDIALGGDVNIIRGKKKTQYSPEFLANYITYVSRNSIAEISQGITIYHLYGRDLKKLSVKLPRIEEQQAIVEILTDMDAEISSLEQQREKTRLLKQGMMQELLTGRIRLI